MAQETPEIVGQWGGIISCVRVREPYLYLNFASRLVVLDISTPLKPRQVGSLRLDVQGIGDIRIHGSYAYVSVVLDHYPRGGLYVVDIASPADLKTLGFLSTYTGISDLVVEGGYAYLAAQDDGLLIVDISDPANPQTACALKIPPRDDWSAFRVWSVEVSGRYAYLGASGFHVIDISDRLGPQPVGYYEMNESPDAIRVHDRHAYCATSDGLVVINVSDPAAPVLAATYGSYNEMGFLRDMALAEDRLFIIGESESVTGCLDVLDIANPARPERIARSNHPGPSLAVSGDHVFAASVWGGLRILESSPARGLVEVGGTFEPRSAEGLVIAGQHAYICTREGVCIADVSDPEHIIGVGFFTDERGVYNMTAAAPYAYLIEGPLLEEEIGVDGMGGGLSIVDMSNPAELRQISFIELPADAFDLPHPGHPSGLIVRGERAYVLWSTFDYKKGSSDTEHILVIDVSRREAPVQIASHSFPPEGGRLEVDGLQFEAGWEAARAIEPEPRQRFVTIPPTPQQVSGRRAERAGIIYEAHGPNGIVLYRRPSDQPRT